MDLLNCFSNIILCLMLTTQFSYLGFGEEILSIIRNPGDGNPWNNFDYFKRPDSKCSTANCATYNAYSVDLDECQCECSYHQSATFGFYSGSWTCLDNTEVRKQTDCEYLLSEPRKNYPLEILKTGQWYDTNILPSIECSVNLTTSKYFKCDGTWTGIDLRSDSSWFSIQRLHENNHNSYEYKVKIDPGISTDLLGRIISLGITCAGHQSSCLLFKVNGTLDCNENVTSRPTRRPATTSQISSRKIVSSDPTLDSNATTNPNDRAKNDKTEESGGSLTVVGVVVTMVIIVAIVIAIIAYVYWKRKRGESVWLVDQVLLRVRKFKSSPTKKTEDKTYEDPEYAEIPEEQRKNGPVDQPGDIYSYAFDDPHTAYGTSQPAPYNKLVHNKQGADQDGALYSSADDGPMYNVLERPLSDDEVIIMTGKTSANTVNDGHLSEDPDQIYHVFEEPDATDETTDTRNDNHDVRASTGTANPSGRLNERVAPKVRRAPPSPPRKI